MKNLKNLNLPLINAHTHTPMIAFRGLAEDLPVDKWLQENIWPAEQKEVNFRMVKKESKRAIKEMKKNKVSFFADMYFFQDAVAESTIEENMPALIGEALIDFPMPNSKNFEEGLKKTEELLKKYKNHKLINVSVAPHSIYTVSRANLIKAKKLAKRYETIYQIHCSETKKEFDDSLKENKKTPVAYLDSLGILDENTLLSHCVWLTDKDIQIIKKRKSAVAHCPISNAKLGSGVAPLGKLVKNNIPICLGTDGAASSNRLDIWEAGKYAALIQKAVNLDASIISAKEIIKMMTINPMKFLKIKKLNGKNLKQWQNEIENKDFSYLYHLNFN